MISIYKISKKFIKEDTKRKCLSSSRTHHGGLTFFSHYYTMTFLTEIIVYILKYLKITVMLPEIKLNNSKPLYFK